MELEPTIDAELATPEHLSEATESVDRSLVDTALVEDELLVEEISIDGMCGVY